MIELEKRGIPSAHGMRINSLAKAWQPQWTTLKPTGLRPAVDDRVCADLRGPGHRDIRCASIALCPKHACIYIITYTYMHSLLSLLCDSACRPCRIDESFWRRGDTDTGPPQVRIDEARRMDRYSRKVDKYDGCRTSVDHILSKVLQRRH